jgi:hypothetical protein
MYKFNVKAKQSHKIYGTNKLLANEFIFTNVLYVIIVNMSVPIKSKSANLGIFNLKKIVVQHKLNAN